MLSRELKTLAAFGLIKRTDYQVVPPKVEYSLTSLGQSLLPPDAWHSGIIHDESRRFASMPFSRLLINR